MSESDPETQRLKRLLRISKANGWCVACVAGGFACISLLSLSLAGVLVGGVVRAAGVMEIKGHRRLEAGLSGARGLMAGSQVLLVICVVLYCWWRLVSFDSSNPLALVGSFEGQIRQMAELALVPMSEIERQVTEIYMLAYRLIAGVTLLFQGGLGLYYWVQVGRVESDSRAPRP